MSGTVSLKKSIATVSLSGPLPDKLEAAALVGFDGVEIFEADLMTFDGTPQDVRRIAEDLDLELVLFQPFRDFEGMPEPQRRANFDRAERKFDLMQTLGIADLLVCSNVHPGCLGDPGRAAADLSEMAERAARRGLRIGYEALAWGRHVSRWRQAWAIVRAADHPALGLVLDSFHTLAIGDDVADLAQHVPAEKLFFVQLADAPRLTMDPLSWSRHFRNFPGQGGLDVAGFVRTVIAAGYRGPLSLEIFNDDFRAAPASLTARDGLRSLIFVAAEAGGPPLPPPPALDGFEFLEFAVDDAGARELVAFLATLGFRHAGTHRSKSVHLWRQGQVNLVVNTEVDSAAAGHFHMHGPSVCAMALRVDDTARAIRRAEALLCPEWREPVGAGERRIPAVRAPDGTLIHFVGPETDGRSLWQDDFVLLADAPEVGDPRLAIDHVAQALPAGRMDSFVLFYRAVLGLQAEPVFELADPYGLVRSRAMTSPDGSVRLPLNISESGKTATGHFVSAYAGAGVHHIAFACTDAARAVAAARERGAPILPVPANYYDDLAARWGLDDATLATLRALDLLYDRDDGGTFCQAYTDAFEDRFFFELVERRGYRGFGAVNASVRMAVQAARREGRHWQNP